MQQLHASFIASIIGWTSERLGAVVRAELIKALDMGVLIAGQPGQGVLHQQRVGEEHLRFLHETVACLPLHALNAAFHPELGVIADRSSALLLLVQVADCPVEVCVAGSWGEMLHTQQLSDQASSHAFCSITQCPNCMTVPTISLFRLMSTWRHIPAGSLTSWS